MLQEVEIDLARREDPRRVLRRPRREIDWKEVYRALADVGYRGSATVELPGGDKAYLEDVSRRVDLIFNGQ